MPVFFDNADGSSFEELLSRLLSAQGGGQGGGGNRPFDINSLLSKDGSAIVRAAAAKAASRSHPTVEAIHLLSVLTDNTAVIAMIDALGGNKIRLAENITKRLASTGNQRTDQMPPALGPSAMSSLFEGAQIARMFGSALIEPEHIFLAIVAHPEYTGGVLMQEGITAEAIRNSFDFSNGQIAPQQRGKGNGKTPTLDKYSIDLTEQARTGKLDPVIGREKEIEQTTEILLRRTKNNPVLIGEPGTGKTAIAEGLAQAIAADRVPELLRGRRLVALDLTGMVAGAKFRGEFEERITKVIAEVVEHKDEIILFIDELHMVIGAGNGGNEGGMDAGNILKPRLARGDLHMIGATTLKEYRRIEKDAAFERRFQPVKVAEPSTSDTVLILEGIKKNYEAHHQVTYTGDAIVAAVNLSARYISDRFLPDKAIDLIDQAGARKRLNAGPALNVAELQQQLADLERDKHAAVEQEQYETANEIKQKLDALTARLDAGFASNQQQPLTVTDLDIAEIIAKNTGMPLAQLTENDRTRLAHLEDDLHQRVIGQDMAITRIAKAVRRARSGMGDPKKPIGSFLFLGPTGVGKTESAKALAQNLFGTEDALIRFDMSEYGEKHTASRLVGAPPGYVGYDEAGQLTEKVRRNPYSIVLLDEIEKAHPDIFNILLQVLDDGRLTDGQGRTVDFRNTVIIMTSNSGSEFLSAKAGATGFVTSEMNNGYGTDENLRQRVLSRLREQMRPEFLNRIDEIVLFKKLEMHEITQIVRLMLLGTQVRLATQGVSLTITDSAVTWIAEHGYEPEYGARPLQRLIQHRVEDPISDLIINEQAPAGSAVTLEMVGTELQVTTTAIPTEESHLETITV